MPPRATTRRGKQATPPHARPLRHHLQFAFGLGPVDAERIELRDLVQEAFLRRHRHHHAAIGQQDRLAKLQVPVPQCQPLSLEGGDRKILALDEVEHRLRHRWNWCARRPRRSCARRSRPACPARSCAASSASRNGSGSGPRPIDRGRRPSSSASGPPIPRPAAGPRCDRAGRPRRPRSRRRQRARRRPAPAG